LRDNHEKLFGVCLFSYLLGNVNGLLIQMNLEESIKTAQVEALEEWIIRINRSGKSKDLKSKEVDFITEYMKGYWRKDLKSLVSGSDFMKQLPPPLRKKLFGQHLCVGVAENFEDFFGELEAELAYRLIPRLEYCRYSKSGRDSWETASILKAGKVPKNIYFLLTGYVGLYSTDGWSKYISLSAGALYGEAFVVFNIPASYWFKFDTTAAQDKNVDKIEIKSEMYKISAEDFMTIIKDYKNGFQIIRREALRKRAMYRQLKKAFIQQELSKMENKESIFLYSETNTK